MRNTIILPMLLTVAAVIPAYAGDLPASAVPAPVREAFAAAFPQATSLEWDWDEDDQAYEVDARDGKREIEAVYTEAGRLIRSKVDVEAAAIPEAIKARALERHPGAEILGANKKTSERGVVWDVGLRVKGRYRNVDIPE